MREGDAAQRGLPVGAKLRCSLVQRETQGSGLEERVDQKLGRARPQEMVEMGVGEGLLLQAGSRRK